MSREVKPPSLDEQKNISTVKREVGRPRRTPVMGSIFWELWQTVGVLKGPREPEKYLDNAGTRGKRERLNWGWAGTEKRVEACITESKTQIQKPEKEGKYAI